MKFKKAKKPSPEDKARRGKPTGYRFKTEQLKKADGELTALGKKLKFKRPTKAEIAKYKRHKDGSFDNKKIEIYHERRADRTHSDDNLMKKYKKGGPIKLKKYVAVGEKDGYWTVISRPTTKQNAQAQIDTEGSLPEGEIGCVVTLEEAKAHKKIIGAEYLKAGGAIKAKKWIAKALKDKKNKGALRRTATKKGLLRSEKEKLSKTDLHKLEHMGGKTAKRAHLAETLSKFDNGGVVDGFYEFDSVQYKSASDYDKGNTVVVRNQDAGGDIVTKITDIDRSNEDVIYKVDDGGDYMYTQILGIATDTSKGIKKFKYGGQVHTSKKQTESTEPNSAEKAKLIEKAPVPDVEIPFEEMKAILGREPNYPNDFIDGKKYTKCFMRAAYKLME